MECTWATLAIATGGGIVLAGKAPGWDAVGVVGVPASREAH